MGCYYDIVLICILSNYLAKRSACEICSLTHHILLRHLLVVLVHHLHLSRILHLLRILVARSLLLGTGITHYHLVHESSDCVLLKAALFTSRLASAASHNFVEHFKLLF